MWYHSRVVTVFDFNDYRAYLRRVFAENKVRGFRARFSRFVNCHLAYVSQVVEGHKNLTLEQAEAASRFFNHSPSERHYFLLLVHLGRAGTEHLRNYYRDLLESHPQVTR